MILAFSPGLGFVSSVAYSAPLENRGLAFIYLDSACYCRYLRIASSYGVTVEPFFLYF